MTAVVIVFELSAARRAKAVDVAVARLRAANRQQWDATDQTVQRVLDGLRAPRS